MELKSSEEIHKNVDIYYDAIKNGEIILIKHEDKITIDIKDSNEIVSSTYNRAEMHKVIDEYMNTIRYGEIKIKKQKESGKDNISISVSNRNRIYLNNK